MSLKPFIFTLLILLFLTGTASASLSAPTTYSIGYKIWGKYWDMMGENGIRNGTIGGVGNNVTFLDGVGVTFLPISGTTSDLDMNGKNITNVLTINSTQVNVTTLNATNIEGNGSGISQLNTSNLTTQPWVNKTNAGEFTAGTLADARLSSNVPLLNAGNDFTGNMNIHNIQPIFTLNGTNGVGHKWEIQLTGSDTETFLIYDRTVTQARFDINSTGYTKISQSVGMPGLLAQDASYSAVCIDATTGTLMYNSVQTCTFSDIARKKNITVVTQNATPILRNLSVLRYQELNDPSGLYRYGLNSTQVKETMGNTFVGKEKNISSPNYGNVTSINYEAISVALLKGWQEQQAAIQKICSRNATLCS